MRESSSFELFLDARLRGHDGIKASAPVYLTRVTTVAVLSPSEGSGMVLVTSAVVPTDAGIQFL